MVGNLLLDMFAKSPLKPLEQHIRLVAKCSNQLKPFFRACIENKWDEAEAICKQISELENDADQLKREIRLGLPQSIFMPVQRSDVLELLTLQDKIANKAKDIAGRVIGRKLQIPEELSKPFIEFLNLNIDATEKAADAINELDDLLETGFKGREVDLVENMINQLDKIEDGTDSMQIKLRHSLLSMEKDIDPIDVMFLYQILEWVGELADLAERVGARLEIMLAR